MFGQKQAVVERPVTDASVMALNAAIELAAAPAIPEIPAVAAVAGEGNEALVRRDLFRVIRAGVFSTMNASAAVGKTREQMKPAVEQLVVSTAERERLN